jgi:hypothetical protein
MLSVAELAVVRGVLQAYDGDKDGRLTREELERACNQLRVPVPRPSILAGLRRSAGDLAGTTTLIDSLFSAPLDGSEVSSLLDIDDTTDLAEVEQLWLKGKEEAQAEEEESRRRFSSSSSSGSFFFSVDGASSLEDAAASSASAVGAGLGDAWNIACEIVPTAEAMFQEIGRIGESR